MIRQALPNPVRAQQPPVQPQQTRNYTSNNRGTTRGRGRGNGSYRQHANPRYSQYQLRPIYVPDSAPVRYPNHNRNPLLNGPPNYHDSQMVHPTNGTDLSVAKASQVQFGTLATTAALDNRAVKFAPHLQPQMRFANVENVICFQNNQICRPEVVSPPIMPLTHPPVEPDNMYNVTTTVNSTEGAFNMSFYSPYSPYVCPLPNYANYYMQPNQFYPPAATPTSTYGVYPFGTVGTSNFGAQPNSIISNGTVYYNQQLSYGQFTCTNCGKLEYFNSTDISINTDSLTNKLE